MSEKYKLVSQKILLTEEHLMYYYEKDGHQSCDNRNECYEPLDSSVKK